VVGILTCGSSYCLSLPITVDVTVAFSGFVPTYSGGPVPDLHQIPKPQAFCPIYLSHESKAVNDNDTGIQKQVLPHICQKIFDIPRFLCNRFFFRHKFFKYIYDPRNYDLLELFF